MKRGRLGVSGALAGAVNGVFGGGGGMVLAPLLGSWCRVEEKRALANCVATILPCCVLSGGVYLLRTGLDWGMALPYLLGGLAGGFLGGKLFTKVPAVWLRRLLDAYPAAAWLNPEPERLWEYRQSIGLIRQIMHQRKRQ